MSQLKSCVADVMDRIRRRHDADPGEFWHACLFWTFWVSLALFPIGYGWREVTPPLCFIFLLLYYRHAWHRSVLRRLTVWPLFLCAGAMTLIGVVFSTDVWQSFLHGGMGVNKAYILPFIAMECVRSTRDLRRLVHACVLACVWQGLDGMWQAWTGFDFIMGYAPNAGRLTGSLGDYSVGNYMALAMIPAFACWFLLRRRLGVLPAAIVWVVLFIPAFSLLEGASSRSGILAVASAFVFWALLAGGRTGRIALWGCVLVLGGFTLLSFHRMDPSTIAGDGRWSLWSLGWQVFLEHPRRRRGAMSFCLQVAGDGDVFPMLAIYAPYVRDTAITFEYEVPTAAEFGARLHHVLPEYPWLVCRAPGQVLGYAYAHRHMERAAYGWNVECSVYVLGSARGRGVGRALYGALLELLRLQGVVNAYGCIAVPNEPSEALHRATGFSLLGHFPASGWKQGRWHDIVWYGRCLREPGAGEPAPLRPFGSLGQELVDEVLRRHARG